MTRTSGGVEGGRARGPSLSHKVDQGEAYYQWAVAKGLPIKQALKDQTWDRRSCCVCDPKGLTLSCFRETGRE